MYRQLVTVRGPQGEQHFPAAILDTGATHSIVPADVAERLGLVPMEEMEIATAAGVVPMQLSMAVFVVGECEVGAYQVIIGPPGDELSVGFDVIQACGLLRPT